MITEKDTQNLINAFSKVFATKQELFEFKDEIREIIVAQTAAVDGYSKRMENYYQEFLLMNAHMNRQEANFVNMKKAITTASD